MMRITDGKVFNIGHRGARAFAPENTLAAFIKAKAMGCDGVELDVRLSKDRQVVVFHDEDLLRCTNAVAKYPGRDSYALVDFTYDELKALDAGAWFCVQLKLPQKDRQAFLQSLSVSEMADFISQEELDGYASGNVTLPLLKDALDLANKLDLIVNIELKTVPFDGEIMVRKVVDLASVATYADRILISSFNEDYLRHVRQCNATISTALLMGDPLMEAVCRLTDLKTQAYNLGCFWDFPKAGYGCHAGENYLDHIRHLKAAGFAVNIWTCNNPDEMPELLDAGINGVISDYPNRVRNALVDYYGRMRG